MGSGVPGHVPPVPDERRRERRHCPLQLRLVRGQGREPLRAGTWGHTSPAVDTGRGVLRTRLLRQGDS